MQREEIQELINSTINQSLQPGGAVNTFVKEQLTMAVAPGGVLANAFQTIHDKLSAVTKDTSTLSDKIATLTSDEASLDAEFPFRKYEREADEAIMQHAWKRLLVDPDHLSNLAEQMADPAIAHTMSLWAANKTDPELIKLKEACALKHAPRTTWKKLCLPSRGGGPDKFRGFMLDKCDDADKAVACVARRCYTFFTLLEKRYTSMQSTKKHSASKIQDQKDYGPLGKSPHRHSGLACDLVLGSVCFLTRDTFRYPKEFLLCFFTKQSPPC